jgi:hypothetical protein
MNSKKLGNSPIFPSVTYSASSDRWFERYKILSIDDTAEIGAGQNSSWKETQLFGLKLAETPEVLHTITVSNSLSFPMVHNIAPKQLAI